MRRSICATPGEGSVATGFNTTRIYSRWAGPEASFQTVARDRRRWASLTSGRIVFRWRTVPPPSAGEQRARHHHECAQLIFTYLVAMLLALSGVIVYSVRGPEI